jgi:hypothetical protein
MTSRELNAWVGLLSFVVVTAWVLAGAGEASNLQQVAVRVGWGIIWLIVFNIVARIVLRIVLATMQRRNSVAEGDGGRDERSDGKAGRIGYAAAGLAVVAALMVLAVGGGADTGLYVLFTGLMLAGAANAAFRILYYRRR